MRAEPIGWPSPGARSRPASAVALLLLLSLLFSVVGCGGGLQTLRRPGAPVASDELLQRCRSAFPRPGFEAVHAIHAELPFGKGGAFLGVTTSPAAGGPSFRSALLSLEGLVLLDQSYQADAGTTVHRALPPLDRPGVAEGLAADVRLLLFAPPGQPTSLGISSAGRRVCRWRLADDRHVEVRLPLHGDLRPAPGEQPGRAATASSPAAGDEPVTLLLLDDDGGRLREARLHGPWAEGFAARMELQAPGLAGYALQLELVRVDR